MTDWSAIEAEIEAMLAAEGFELVQFEAVRGKGARLAILADHAAAPGTITLDDCAAISRKVSTWLDVVDPFQGPYRLMVSSPGVDRPLNKLAHCERVTGQRVRVKHTQGGRPATVEGTLLAVEGEQLVLEVDGERQVIAWPAVVKANVVYVWDDA
ncbi:MAG: ribosome maturation factor RimP [Armatimonadetes bacterium]|nr:ribosome maturation factor RimP [Armatimonadota bacterium]